MFKSLLRVSNPALIGAAPCGMEGVMMHMKHWLLVAPCLVTVPGLAGCGSDNNTAASATGGTQATGSVAAGGLGTGGTATAGSATGGAATGVPGGTQATGGAAAGSLGTGGTSIAGAAAGGAATGGSGGTQAAGGTAAGGVSTSIAGTATGGAATGGSGGAQAAGGTAVATSGGTAGATTGGTAGTAGAGGSVNPGGTGGGTNGTGGSTGGTGGTTGGTAAAGGAAGGSGGATAGTGGSPGGTGGAGGSIVCGAEGPSCAGGLDCSGESCCKSLPVPGGSYNRNADPAYPATVGNFCLDKYEVTVGRFRSFLAAYNAWRGASHPAAGEGTHDNAATGWDTAWTGNLPANALVFTDGAHLTYCVDYTWSDSAGSGTPDPEAYPINCVSWYEAFAFCVWDGGYLPTEAQWEYAAGGGSENRVYPWGNTPNVDPLPANYLNNHNTPFLDVGSEPAGNGRWGQSDLAGGMWEWVFDWDTDYSSVCNDCVNPTPSSNRIARGGSWYQDFGLEAAYRLGGPPAGHYRNLGLRCARTVP